MRESNQKKTGKEEVPEEIDQPFTGEETYYNYHCGKCGYE